MTEAELISLGENLAQKFMRAVKGDKTVTNFLTLHKNIDDWVVDEKTNKELHELVDVLELLNMKAFDDAGFVEIWRRTLFAELPKLQAGWSEPVRLGFKKGE